MSKIIFIEPQPPNLHYFSRFTIPRLGIFILGGIMKKRGWEVELFIEEVEKLDWNRIKSADIVGISSITSTAPRAYKIADKVRDMGIPVIMGGVHPTFLTEEALQHSDFVIRGEGENPLIAFIDTWEKKGDFSSVPNLSYKKNDKIVHNPEGNFITNLDKIPFPDFSVFKDKDIKTIRGKTIVAIQTSRGCPFQCSFCSVTAMFGRKYRFRSVENIIRELRQYKSEENFLFFYDDNFAANPEQTKELLNAMIREKFKFHWSAQVRVDIAKDPELVKLMKKAGCYTVYIGFESINPESLCEMKKSQKIEDIVKGIKIFQNNNIHIHGMFILGFDQDNWKTMKKTVQFARRSRLTSFQFSILTPFPGTELYKKIKADDRIIFDDWSLYDVQHVVFKPANFSISELQYAQIYSHKKFYSTYERIRKFITGDKTGLLINFYGHHLIRLWKKKNKNFLKVLDLLKQDKKSDVVIDYREKIALN